MKSRLCDWRALWKGNCVIGGDLWWWGDSNMMGSAHIWGEADLMRTTNVMESLWHKRWASDMMWGKSDVKGGPHEVISIKAVVCICPRLRFPTDKKNLRSLHFRLQCFKIFIFKGHHYWKGLRNSVIDHMYCTFTDLHWTNNSPIGKILYFDITVTAHCVYMVL